VTETLPPDGDPLAAMVCVSEPTFPGCIVLTRPVTALRFDEEKGSDDHLLCVPCGDPGRNAIDALDQVPDHLLAEAGHFFAVCRDLDTGRACEVSGWGDRAEAAATIDLARRRSQEAQ
jgi:inorganic pyrophosphatase